jgi:Fic family protein
MWSSPSVKSKLATPPPPDAMTHALADLERFMHEEDHPDLTRAGLVHAQFETIHPFLDGNGRIGRLLITFLVCPDPDPKPSRRLISLRRAISP